MKNAFVHFTGFGAAMIILAGQIQLRAQPQTFSVGRPDTTTETLGVHQDTLTGRLSSEIKPLPVLTAMQRVADWQLANPATNAATGWIQAAGDAGFMALAGISGDTRYR